MTPYKVQIAQNSAELMNMRKMANVGERADAINIHSEVVMTGLTNLKTSDILVNIIPQVAIAFTSACLHVIPRFWKGLTTKQMKRSTAISNVLIMDISIESKHIMLAEMHTVDAFHLSTTNAVFPFCILSIMTIIIM